MVNRVDKMIITGGMAFTFLKEHFGMQIGSSLFDKKGAKYVKEIMDYASDKGVKLEFPVDFRVCKQFKDGQKMIPATLEDGIPNGYLGLDVGPRTIEKFRKIISQSKTIFLNGSNGVFEFKSTRPGSIALVNQVVEATKNGAISVCGGGDTVSLVNLVPGASKEISHISTGGGASIELMEGHKLPGIEYLSNKDDVSHLL
jgi:phosphoglycerate kinase